MRILQGAVLALIVTLTPIAAFASEAIQIQNEIPKEKKTYDFREDPFLLEWTFKTIAETASEKKVELSAEDKMLLRWKAKQADKWANLPKGTFIVNASAYTAAADECGNDKGITASGLMVAEERTLACPPEFPFGAKIFIEGVGERRCEDRGGAIKGNHVDIYVQTKTEAFAFGRKNLEAYVIE